MTLHGDENVYSITTHIPTCSPYLVKCSTSHRAKTAPPKKNLRKKVGFPLFLETAESPLLCRLMFWRFRLCGSYCNYNPYHCFLDSFDSPNFHDYHTTLRCLFGALGFQLKASHQSGSKTASVHPSPHPVQRWVANPAKPVWRLESPQIVPKQSRAKSWKVVGNHFSVRKPLEWGSRRKGFARGGSKVGLDPS